MLGRDFSPNTIHKLIFNLNPTHIITTNYDKLLETYANENQKSYFLISKDSDFAYAPSNNLIIKMHGDLQQQNFVLTEEDYLSYSSNFPLTENYIKGLFATHTVLFLGFSGNDPNFKQIHHWTRQILGKHTRLSYLIDVSSSTKKFDFDYFRDRGIILLSAQTVANEFNVDVQANLESLLADVLGLFDNYHMHLSGLKLFDWLHSVVNGMQHMQAILPLMLSHAIAPYYTSHPINDHWVVVAKGHLSELAQKGTRQKLISQRSNKAREFCLIFKKSMLKSVNIQLPNTTKETTIYSRRSTYYDLNSYSNFYPQIDEFDLHSIQQSIERNTITTTQPDEYSIEFLRATALIEIGDAKSALLILRSIAADAYSKHDYWKFFIAKLNLHNLVRSNVFWHSDHFTNKYVEIEQFWEEENISKILEYIPRSAEHESALRTVIGHMLSGTYYQKMSKDIKEIQNRFKDCISTLASGGYTSYSHPLDSQFNTTLVQYEQFFFMNHIITCIHPEYKNFMMEIGRTALLSYKYQQMYRERTKSTQEEDTQSIWAPPSDTGYYSLFCVIKFTPEKELHTFLSQENIINIEVTDTDFNKMATSFSNLVRFICKGPKQRNVNSVMQYWFNFMRLFLIVSQGKHNWNDFLSILMEYLSKNKRRMDKSEYRLTSRSLYRILSYNSITELTKFRSETATLLFSVLRESPSPNEWEALIEGNGLQLLRDCLINIAKDQSGTQTTLSSSEHDKYLNALNHVLRNCESLPENHHWRSEISTTLFIPLLKHLEENLRSRILDFVLSQVKTVNDDMTYAIFFSLLIREEHRFSPSTVDSYLEYLKSEKSNLDRRLSQPYPLIEKVQERNNFENKLFQFGILAHRKLIDSDSIAETLEQFAPESEFLNFVVAPDKFDYSQFDAKWLSYFDEGYQDFLMSETDRGQIIFNKVKETLTEEINENSRLRFFERYAKQF